MFGSAFSTFFYIWLGFVFGSTQLFSHLNNIFNASSLSAMRSRHSELAFFAIMWRNTSIYISPYRLWSSCADDKQWSYILHILRFNWNTTDLDVAGSSRVHDLKWGICGYNDFWEKISTTWTEQSGSEIDPCDIFNGFGNDSSYCWHCTLQWALVFSWWNLFWFYNTKYYR